MENGINERTSDERIFKDLHGQPSDGDGRNKGYISVANDYDQFDTVSRS